MFDSFNHFVSILILLLWSAISSVVPQPPTSRQPLAARAVATPSAIISIPKTSVATSSPVLPAGRQVPWGETEKIGDHLYRLYVANDPAMGAPAEILAALNGYRQTHGAGEVRSDDGLCKLAQIRAQEQEKLGNLDSHQGLIDYMNDESHWQQLNITAIGENASYGYVLSGVHLIEWVFNADEEHRANQLNPQWNLACPAVAGVTVDIIFGKR